MNNFEKIRFKGTFRSYQSRVLDNADEYLKDGRINIVAAPGSGKTVLGLELIRRLNAPCIILSPIFFPMYFIHFCFPRSALSL